MKNSGQHSRQQPLPGKEDKENKKWPEDEGAEEYIRDNSEEDTPAAGITDYDALKNATPHKKDKEQLQKRSEEEFPFERPIDKEELAGDEPLPDDR